MYATVFKNSESFAVLYTNSIDIIFEYAKSNKDHYTLYSVRTIHSKENKNESFILGEFIGYTKSLAIVQQAFEKSGISDSNSINYLSSKLNEAKEYLVKTNNINVKNKVEIIVRD
ncbi:MAG: hypothetical protein LC122_14260 [Chitinophagales bacterium]|nr:hypothetical protein [Chitinophagales bacterium]